RELSRTVHRLSSSATSRIAIEREAVITVHESVGGLDLSQHEQLGDRERRYGPTGRGATIVREWQRWWTGVRYDMRIRSSIGRLLDIRCNRNPALRSYLVRRH